ncbi:MAG TPA: glycine/betaine ABC transporter substrate-binding protein [Planctomycetes bacterium]|nr:glycine/betaine ABC transporter substrate-binding protein [Planctomycetota bacterium]
MDTEKKYVLIGALIGVITLILAVGALWMLTRPADLVIGCKNFTESRLLAEIMVQAAERQAGIRVQRLELGSTGLCWDALAKDAIHAYPEYTGTLLTDILKQPPVADPFAALVQVRAGLGNRPDLVLGRPFGLNDTYVLAMRDDEARRLGVTCISDLTRHPTLVAGFTSEFNQRPDGWPGLAKHYGLRLERPPVDLSPGHMYQAVRDGQVAVISAFSTDARLRQFGLTALGDDRRFFPAYEAVPIMRQDRLSRYPAVATAWAELAGRINDATMMGLNQRVDLNGERVATVAASFLDSLGIQKVQP